MDSINTSEHSDLDLAAYMRDCNNEKFVALVRMHLSFELDLNTDLFDLPFHDVTYEDKGKTKKWNPGAKKGKGVGVCSSAAVGHCASLKTSSHSPEEPTPSTTYSGIFQHMEEFKKFFLMEKNITQEGIFRKTGSTARQNDLRQRIQRDKSLDLENSGYSVHDCATVFKSCISEFPEPLLTDAHYPAHQQIAPLCLSVAASNSTTTKHSSRVTSAEHQQREQHLLSCVQLLLLLLPDENRQLLAHIIEILYAVALREAENKMSAHNLATLFAPHLICPRNLPPEALHSVSKQMSSIVAYLITRGMDIFKLPIKLATDIRAYFVERKRKKIMSPEQALDESISDVSTVNTVYTFVNRELSEAFTHTSNTDTELAQLYAHIQGMPESSKKRRLIKQFNKQNGQGTPLQMVVTNRPKNGLRSAKSLGDSIKKHIFHKGLISRTPKRPTAIAPPIYDQHAPNMDFISHHKSRVLFQSPTPNSKGFSYIGQQNDKPHANVPMAILVSQPEENDSVSIGSSLISLASSVSTKSEPIFGSNSVSLEERGIGNCISNSIAEVTSNSFLQKAEHSDSCIRPIPLDFTDKATKPSEKKNVAWNDDELVKVSDISDGYVPLKQVSDDDVDTDSRYKSEPNLATPGLNELTPPSKNYKSLSRKLMKGVSIGNIRLAFGTPVSSKYFDEQNTAEHTTMQCGESALDKLILDDTGHGDRSEDLKVDSESTSLSEPVTALVANTYDHLREASENIMDNLLTSTPSTRSMGRRSMSPITKSAQRMPRAMQESIMTPRSRKPVMVFAPLTMGGSDSNQTNEILQTESSNPNELYTTDDSFELMSEKKQPEPPVLHSEDAISLGGFAEFIRARNLLFPSEQQSLAVSETRSNNADSHNSAPQTEQSGGTALSSTFKNYLLTRSVQTALSTPVSLSSCHSGDCDDEQSYSPGIDNLDESQLTNSMLYCLDGNTPDAQLDDSNPTRETSISPKMTTLPATPLSLFNNARKRSATNDATTASNISDKSSALSVRLNMNAGHTPANKENSQQTEDRCLSKKLLVAEFHEETSF